uniref:Cystatin domain-containing protein n=1 Tax=Proboscia inermis TaxID=420281 RepID=A0A7S0GNJ3_9STRA|mmetsp:Transcript_735/g.782  ORF Transcript_735/g.782 Transcript_735/m.782 type:complete len:136 (+) Transcript_735:50-457(+)
MFMKRVLIIATVAISCLSNTLISAMKPSLRNNRGLVGGFQEADINDPRVQKAAKFATEQHLADHGRAVDLGIGPNDLHFEVVDCSQQVVAGMNYRLTIALMRNNECEERFHVMIYDRFGEYTVTQWGDPLACTDQ